MWIYSGLPCPWPQLLCWSKTSIYVSKCTLYLSDTARNARQLVFCHLWLVWFFKNLSLFQKTIHCSRKALYQIFRKQNFHYYSSLSVVTCRAWWKVRRGEEKNFILKLQTPLWLQNYEFSSDIYKIWAGHLSNIFKRIA